MKKLLNILMMSLLFTLWISCKEEGRLDHIDKNAPAPGQVYDVTVRNTNGGAVIKYKLPKDDNLLYVMAEYEIRPGVRHQAKSAYYSDSIIVEGFGKVDTYDIKLYSVGRNEKASEPVIQQVNPLTPPIQIAFENLVLQSGFGGVTALFKNEAQVNLAISILKDTLDHFELLQSFYTSAPSGSFSYRGLDSIEQKFGVYLRDRFDNVSDTIVANLTPLFEEFIPKNTFEEVHLPTDTWEPIEGRDDYSVNRIWDGITNERNIMFASKNDSPMPQWFTFDMGKTVILSRMKVHHRTNNTQYTQGNVRKFEIWGSMLPNMDGSWDESWIPLGNFECYKLLGDSETITQEDKDYANIEGIDFDFAIDEFAPNPFVPVRYIRFKTLETYNGPANSGSVWIAEISFWGQIQE